MPAEQSSLISGLASFLTSNKKRVIATLAASLLPAATYFVYQNVKYFLSYVKLARTADRLSSFNPQTMNAEELEDLLEDIIAMCKSLIHETTEVINKYTQGDDAKMKEMRDTWLRDWLEGKAHAHYNLGKAYSAKMIFSESIEELKAALRIYEITDNLRGQSIVYNDMGLVFQTQMNSQRALESFVKSADLLTEYKKKHPELYEKPIDKSNLELMRDLQNEATIYSNVALGFNTIEQHERAIPYVKMALEIDRKCGYYKESILDLRELSLSYEKTKQYDLDIQTIEELLKVSQDNGQVEEETNCYSRLSVLNLVVQNYTAAENYVRKAIKQCEELLAKGFKYLDEANKEQSASFLIINYQRPPRQPIRNEYNTANDFLIETYIRTKKYKDALVHAENSRFEEILVNLDSSSASTSCFFPDLKSMPSEVQGAVQSVVQKKVSVEDLVATSKLSNSTIIYYHFAPEIIVEEKPHRIDIWVVKASEPNPEKQVQYKSIELNLSKSSTSIDYIISSIVTEIAQIQQLNQEKEASQPATANPTGFGFMGGNSRFGLSRKQKVTSKAQSHDVNIEEEQNLTAAAEQIVGSALKPLAAGLNDQDISYKIRKNLRLLHQFLIEPIRNLLTTGEKLTIIPHIFLCQVPFYGLLDSSTNHYMVDDFTISMAASFKMIQLHHLQQTYNCASSTTSSSSPTATRPPISKKLIDYLVVCNPNIKLLDTDVMSRTNVITDISVTSQEGKLISELFKRTLPTSQGSLMEGDAAEKSALLKTLEEQSPRYVHLATHGDFDVHAHPIDQYTMKGELLLSSNEAVTSPASASSAFGINSDKLPYKLYAKEVSNLNLRGTELVSISVAEFVKAAIFREGTIALSLAVHNAGVPGAVYSLWKLHPAAHTFVYYHMYKNLLGYSSSTGGASEQNTTPMSKAEALREAILQTKKKFPNPIIWSSFQHTGV